MSKQATFTELEETWARAGDIWNVATTGMEPKPEGPPWVRSKLQLSTFKHLLAMKGLRVAPHHECTGADASTLPFSKREREPTP